MALIEYVLFDLDQTLIDTFGAHVKLTNNLLAKIGLAELTKEQAEGLRLLPPKEFLRGHIMDAQILVKALEMREKMTEVLEETTLYPGVREVLTALQKRVKAIGLVTNRRKRSTTSLLDYHNLSQIFADCCITHDDFTHRKPHPEPIEKTLIKLGVNGTREKVVYIGDNLENDYIAARDAGVKFLGFGNIDTPHRFDNYHLLEEALRQID